MEITINLPLTVVWILTIYIVVFITVCVVGMYCYLTDKGYIPVGPLDFASEVIGVAAIWFLFILAFIIEQAKELYDTAKKKKE